MSVKLKIKVTKDVLLKSAMCGTGHPVGQLSNGSHCAVALAVQDIFPNAHVTRYDIHPFGHNPGDTNTILLPNEVKDFIVMFDVFSPKDRLGMPEIEFEVEIPDEIIEQINIEELKPLLKNHPTLQLITPYTTIIFNGCPISAIPDDEGGYGYYIEVEDPIYGRLHAWRESKETYGSEAEALAAGKSYLDNFEPVVNY